MPKSLPRVVSIAERLQGPMRARFLKAVGNVRKKVKTSELIAAIETGNVALVNHALKLGTLPVELADAAAVIKEAVVKAGRVTILDIGLQVRFDIRNPFAEHAATSHAAKFVTATTSSTRQAIAAIVRRGLEEGIHPREQARLIKPMIGVTNRQASAAMNMRAALLQSGVPPAQVSNIVGKYIDRKIRERAENIARTETIRASNAGTDAAWRDAIDKGLIRVGGEPREWIAADSERTCPICTALDEQIVGFEDYFIEQASATVVQYPPAHPRCRCAVALVYEKL